MNDDDFVATAMSRIGCAKHGALLNRPCWEIHRLKDARLRLPAICNRRAIRAGMNGPVDPRSLRKR